MQLNIRTPITRYVKFQFTGTSLSAVHPTVVRWLRFQVTCLCAVYITLVVAVYCNCVRQSCSVLSCVCPVCLCDATVFIQLHLVRSSRSQGGRFNDSFSSLSSLVRFWCDILSATSSHSTIRINSSRRFKFGAVTA